MYHGRFCFEYWPDDKNTGLFRSSEGLAAREEKVVRFDDAAQGLRRAAIDHGWDFCPVNRAAAHDARFGAGVEGGFRKNIGRYPCAGKLHQIQFGVPRRVMGAQGSVFRREDDMPCIVRQQRPKRMIAIPPGASRQFDRLPDVPLMSRIPARRAAPGPLDGCLRDRHSGKRNRCSASLQKLAAIRDLHSFVVPRLGKVQIGLTLKNVSPSLLVCARHQVLTDRPDHASGH